MASLFAAPASWWGVVLLAAGAVTGIVGIAFAIGQTDVKRLLAYSSIENIGIIAMGIGLALLGRSYARADWVLLGLGAALFHVWNHGLFKSLLFFDAGAIIHAAGTRNIDSLGGLAKRMPRTMAFFSLGAVAICALPPLNGFAGELLLYVGLFRTMGLEGGTAVPGAAVAVVALAMIGALAVATFVKLFGAVFLGAPRSQAADHAHDPSRSMLFAMSIVSLVCVAFGIFPLIALPMIERAAETWAAPLPGTGGIAALVPLHWVSVTGLALLALVLLAILVMKILPRSASVEKRGTWDCGYAAPTPRMEYTGSSFGRPVVELFKYIIYPKTPRISIQGPFPEKTRYDSDVPDTIYERLVLPLVGVVSRIAPRFRFLQQGQTHLYVLYIFIILIVLLIGGGVL
jgi:hydrogenase-4 component B